MTASNLISEGSLKAGERSDRPRGSGYLPTLDGWRAIAIVAVMLSHDATHRIGPLSTHWLYEHGHLGVDIFFAISGILICSRLLAEEETTGEISLRGFYIRRALRILPAAVLFLAALIILKATVHLPVELPEVFASLFFLRNYTASFSHFQTVYSYYTSHFWSLAVEEHFYLILPGLLVVTPKRLRAAALLVLAAAVSLHRIAPNSWLSFHTDIRLDALLVPAALAVLLRNSGFRQRLIAALPYLTILPALVLLLIAKDELPRTTGLLVAWLAPLLILATMLHPASWFSRLLESAPLRFVGRISYSLYLWQQLFLVSHFGADTGQLGPLQTWPLSWLMAFGCSLLSYYLVEQPMIRLGHRLASHVSKGKITAPPERILEG